MPRPEKDNTAAKTKIYISPESILFFEEVGYHSKALRYLIYSPQYLFGELKPLNQNGIKRYARNGTHPFLR